jgi:hypothetical protein
MNARTQLPGFKVDLSDDDDAVEQSSLAQLAHNLDLPAIRPSPAELRAVEEAGERIGFSRREPQPIAKPKRGKIAKPPPKELMLTIRLDDHVKTRFQDLCYAQGRTAKVSDTLERMMNAFEWAQLNGWKG